MKAKMKQALICTILAIAMLASFTIFVYAAEDDPYSDWAAWSILVASDIYEFGNEQTFSGYVNILSEEKFAPVHASINAKFDTDD